jgi:uncharacterized membrane protein
MKREFRKSQLLTMHAALIALVLLSLVVPLYLSAFAAIAVLALISVVVSAEFLGFWHGCITGAFFGLVSLLAAIIVWTPLSFAFKNPLISVLPRVLIGAFSYLSYKGVTKISDKIPKLVAYAIGAIAGVVTNTVGVLGLLYAFYHGRAVGEAVVSWNFSRHNYFDKLAYRACRDRNRRPSNRRGA